ncbi:hypothetical protein MMC28_003025 [Mycoblastus sanguinarius]|nr:hypothetical protein [Mycoblastus sanguinarius]
MSFIFLLAVSTLLNTVFAANFLRPSQVRSLPSQLHDTTSSSLEYLNSTSDFDYDIDLLSDNNANVLCNGERFGINLSRGSCNLALQRMNQTTDIYNWGQRRTPGAINFNVKLPFRILSYDGFCAVDIVHKKGAISDYASGLEVHTAAQRVLNGCVKSGAPNEGGYVGSVGQSGNLVVIVRLYTPVVRCMGDSRSAPPRGSCQKVLDALPVSMESLVFGPMGNPTVRAILPRSFAAAYTNCRMGARISVGQTPDTSRWFDMWAGAIAVNTLCVQNGRIGKVYQIGANGRLEVFVDKGYSLGIENSTADSGALTLGTDNMTLILPE